MSFTVRPAVERDIPQILAMIREFAESENLSQHCDVTEERLRLALFDEKAKVAEAILAVEDEIPVGYAVFYPNFLTFRGQHGFYLEDIYLKPEVRGRNFGEKMLRYVAKLGKSRRFERMDFQVLEHNTRAINFYKKLGAAVNEDERHFKFTDQAFQKLAL
jgi:ribosomal protein S18 acetylase RimI-like enzyme